MRLSSATIIGTLALVAASCAPAADTAARHPMPPVSEAAAQKAVAQYLPLWLNGATPVHYSFRPLASGAVDLGFGLREAGWFMCGTVDVRNAASGPDGARTFFAHFDPAHPDLVYDGAVGDGPSGSLVNEWCTYLYRG